jgi:2,3-diketo-5-methylthio-1-phosphopentane phosphatase
MSESKPVVFSDFDGSFCQKDVGHQLFKHFSGGRNLELVERWKKGEISSRECLLREASMIKATTADIYDFINSFDLMPGAVELYESIRRSKIPFYLVSDGNDIYIKQILEKNGLSDIQFFSNHGEISGGSLTLSFPYDNRGCKRCGTCKGARILDIIEPDTKEWNVVFIGDGLSDLCALPNADKIFARGELLNYCRLNNIEAIEYSDFFDILNRLRKSGFFYDQ